MNNLPQRKRIRLQGYDYSQNGAYFITICAKNRAIFFGAVNDGMMTLNQTGEVASRHIKEIKEHIVGVTVANYVVMPNHIHMILMVDTPSVGTRYIVSEAQAPCMSEAQMPCVSETRTPYMASLRGKSKQTIPKAIQQFKVSVSKETQTIGLWQARYHDHIIRNEREYQKIWDYIDTNPSKWEEDCFYHA